MASGHALVLRGMVDRSVLAHPLFMGVSTAHLASLVEELAGSSLGSRGGGATSAREGVACADARRVRVLSTGWCSVRDARPLQCPEPGRDPRVQRELWDETVALLAARRSAD
ncbi:hypothetical protein GCM10011579_033260 [Streptomyces albiflavescens]|uniref:Uncharacterized protein n=1 Tax=Streptomyces albiflavescens TaxID=1623582 RepID=A0A917Y1R8_9ACTN|nr:hypothetical protein GCM10011579_033260 [Streptomyces albiflavescens]